MVGVKTKKAKQTLFHAQVLTTCMGGIPLPMCASNMYYQKMAVGGLGRLLPINPQDPNCPLRQYTVFTADCPQKKI